MPRNLLLSEGVINIYHKMPYNKQKLSDQIQYERSKGQKDNKIMTHWYNATTT